MTGVATAHMHDPGYVVCQSIKTALQAFNTEIQCHIDIASKQWLIHLYMFAARVRPRADFELEAGRVEMECLSVRLGRDAGDGDLRRGHGLLGRLGDRSGDRAVVEELRLRSRVGVDQPVLRSSARPVAVPEAVGLPDPLRRDRSAVRELLQEAARLLLGQFVVALVLGSLCVERRAAQDNAGDER